MDIQIPCYNIRIITEGRGGSITSDLSRGLTADSPLKAAIDGFESLLLACACSGLPVQSPAFLEAIETAVSHIEAEWSESNVSKTKLFLMDNGPQKINVIKAIRQYSGLGLKEAKEITDFAGSSRGCFEVLDRQLEMARKDLQAAGATVRVESKADYPSLIKANLVQLQNAIENIVSCLEQIRGE